MVDSRARRGWFGINVGSLGFLIAVLGAPGSWAGDSAAPAPGWQPALHTTWQIQYSGTPIDTSANVQMYDLDGFDTDASLVAALHGQGRKVACYISAGSWEDWRPDANQFPAAVLGNDYDGWPGEKWLDIRQISTLSPIIQARLDLCRDKGFDAVDPDNVNGYQNPTGFALTYADQIAFNTWLANQAHARDLSIGLKNDTEQAGDLITAYDWTLTEECFDQGWCSDLSIFTNAGKAVFDIEYTDTSITSTSQFCAQAATLNINAILKHRNLDAGRAACPEATPTRTATRIPTLTRTPTRTSTGGPSATRTPTRTATRTPTPACSAVTWTAAMNLSIAGNTITRLGSTNSWSAGAVSNRAIASGDGAVQATVASLNDYVMFGLSHGNTDARYADIDFALYTYPGDHYLRIYEGGTSRGRFGSYAMGDVLRVAVTGGHVKYYRNGGLLYTSTLTPSYPLLLDSALYSVGAQLKSATICGAAVAAP